MLCVGASTKKENIIQISLNVPDNLPSAIVQQYIKTIETQLLLLSKLNNPITESKSVSLKRDSGKQMISFIADDFCEPLDEFKEYS